MRLCLHYNEGFDLVPTKPSPTVRHLVEPWENPQDEVLFREIGSPVAASKKAYRKLQTTCQIAMLEGDYE
jgi:hypothetical protein